MLLNLRELNDDRAAETEMSAHLSFAPNPKHKPHLSSTIMTATQGRATVDAGVVTETSRIPVYDR
jgi:hypothetical protein